MDIFSPTIIDNAIITGSNNASLLQVSSPSAASAFFISGSGRVGIGTTSPLSTLTVAGGDININSGYSIGGNALGSYVPFLRYNNTGAGVPSSSFGHTTAYITSLGGGVFGTNDLIFYAGGLTQTEIVRIVGSTGFVGIGESSPSAKLEIKGSGATSATTAFRVENSNASASLVVLDNGNIGIGTTTPQFKLHVLGTAGGDATFNGGILVENNNATDGEAALAFRVNSMAAASNYWFTGINQSNNYDIAYGTSFTNANTALSISSSRNIGIGTISPSAQLHISGSATTPLRIQNPATTLMQISSSVANSGSIVFFGTTPTAAGLDLEIQSNGAANGGQVRIAGNGTQWDFGSVSAVARNGTGNSEMFSATMTGTSTTLVQNPVRIQFNANQSSAGGGGYTVLRLNATHASTAGTGSKLLQTWEFGGVAQSVMDISGSLGIGTGSAPSARLFISGASNQALFKIDSPAVNNIIYVSGSGNVGIGTGTPTNTLQVVGGITATSITASIISASSGITGSLFGTSSWAQSASNAINAQTASFLPVGTYQITSSWAQSASNAINAQTASFLPVGTYQITSSWAQSASNAINAQTASFLPVETYQITSSWAVSASNSINARTSSNIFPAITNNTSSYVLTATGNGTINGNSNLTFDGSVLTVTGRANISTSITSSTATVGFGLTSALNAGQTTIRGSGVDTVGALTIQNSGGTAVFTVLNGGTTGVGENNPSARLHVKGSGATSTTTALRVENSNASASLVVLDDRQTRITSDGAALFVQGAGVSPFTQNIAEFRYAGNGNSLIISAQNGIAGLTTSTNANLNINPNGTGATVFLAGKQVTLNNSNNNGIIALQNTGATGQTRLDFITGSSTIMSISGSGNVGIGTATPVHNLVVDGNTGVSINAGGATFPNIHRDSADGGMLLRSWNGSTFTNNVKITPTTEVGIGTTTPTAELHISGASNSNLLRVGSPSATNALFVSGSGNVGIGTNLPSAELHISGASIDSLLRVGSPTQANTLFITGSNRVGIGTGTPRALFEVNDKIIAEAGGNVGIQTTADYWIHLSTDPGGGKHLNIDAAQSGNPPAEYTPSAGNTVNKVVGNISDGNVLGTPDYWMEIRLGGTTVLIPCYTPTP